MSEHEVAAPRDTPGPEATGARVKDVASPRDDVNRDVLIQQRGASLQARHHSFEHQDQAVLTLSTAALGLSLGFLRDIPTGAAVLLLPLLVSSWALFAVAIVSTFGSFVASRKAIDAQLDVLDDVLFGDVRTIEKPSTRWSTITTWLNGVSWVTFVGAIILTVVFVGINTL